METLLNDLQSTPEILLRSLASVLALFFFTRFMGKKQLSQLNFFDYAIGISIGSIAAEMAADVDTPYFHAILAMAVYTFVSVGIAVLSVHSLRLRRFFDGTPTLLVYQGKLLNEGLKRSRINVNELLAECRGAGYFDIGAIEYAILESNGRISFCPKGAEAPLTPKDMNLPPQQAPLPAAVIIDGEIMVENLEAIGQNQAYLLEQLRRKKLQQKDILLATCDSQGKVCFYPAQPGYVPTNYYD